MSVKRIQRTDSDRAVEVLAAAFCDYPVMRYVLADAGQAYDAQVRDLIGFFCEKRWTRDWPVLGVRVDGDLAGVALVSEATDGPPAAIPDALRAGLEGRIGAAAVERLVRYEEESELDAPEGPHHFLGVIGVHPRHQGKGLATLLLREVARLSEAHPFSTGVCLNTESPENVPLYEHMGYRILGERDVGPLHTWCMFRAKQGM